MTHQGTNLPPRYDIKGVCHTFAGEWEGQLVAQPVKNLPAMQETWIQPLGQEDSLEKEMATHSSLLTWEIPWTGERGGLHSMRLRKSWR